MYMCIKCRLLSLASLQFLRAEAWFYSHAVIRNNPWFTTVKFILANQQRCFYYEGAKEKSNAFVNRLTRTDGAIPKQKTSLLKTHFAHLIFQIKTVRQNINNKLRMSDSAVFPSAQKQHANKTIILKMFCWAAQLICLEFTEWFFYWSIYFYYAFKIRAEGKPE